MRYLDIKTEPLLLSLSARGASPALYLSEGLLKTRQMTGGTQRYAPGDLDGESLLISVETTAEAHQGYEQLFNIAEFRQNTERLFSQMTTLKATGAVFEQQSMATYVFSRLLKEGRTGELLQLPEEFNDGIKEWLSTQASQSV